MTPKRRPLAKRTHISIMVTVMNIIMRNIYFESITEVEEFLQGNKEVDIIINNREEKYDVIRNILVTLRYTTLRKKDKGLVKKCLEKVTGYSEQQTKRLIKTWKKNGLKYIQRSRGNSFNKKYNPKDIALLIKTDIAHNILNGNAVREILKREYSVFGNEEYSTISNISTSHIYYLRKHNRQYTSSDVLSYTKTRPVQTDIGERRKPYPDGKPGYLRIDSVHQGDLNGVKGVYHINIVDAVNQWEIIGCIERISNECLVPLIEDLLDQFPYVIIGFHSDNGSEYINRQVAKMLNRLLITQTKSRARKSNDNALVESKNGAVIRKHMGRNHITKENAFAINMFYKNTFNVYLNYHRICAYSTDYVDKRGKIRKKYETYSTPFERFKNTPNSVKCLKPGVSFAQLDKIAYAESDNTFAEAMQKEKLLLFKSFKK